MKLKEKNILLISPESWDHIFVSKHHYAVHLGRLGNNVFFLNPPRGRAAVRKVLDDNVYVVDYQGFPKGLRFYPRLLRQFFIKRVYRQIAELCKVDFDIIWSFDNSVFFDFSLLPQRLTCISHIVDLNQDFQTKRAAETADICFGVIDELVKRLRRFNSNTHLISHGVQDSPKHDLKVALPGGNLIKAIYIGNLDMVHIKWDLVYMLAKSFNEVDFLFVGPSKSKEPSYKEMAFQCKNFYHIEAIPSEYIPAYLRVSDILLLIYDDEYAIKYASPHKFLEYLASGKFIVSTWLDEYSKLNDGKLMNMSKTNEDYTEQFGKILSNIQELNSTSNVSKRKSIAAGSSYWSKIEQIESLLSQ